MNSMKARPRTKSGLARGEMEGQRGAPILRDEIGRLCAEAVDEGVEIAHVVGKSVIDVGMPGLSKAHEVRAPRNG